MASAANMESTEGNNWRVHMVWTIENDKGENWVLDFKGPRTDYATNVKHNYLLLNRIFGDDDSGQSAMQSLINKLNVF